MNRYQVMLRGENFLLDFVDEENKCGFFTTVWVKANDPEEAELNAVAELRKHEDLKSGLLNKPDSVHSFELECYLGLDNTASGGTDSGFRV